MAVIFRACWEHWRELQVTTGFIWTQPVQETSLNKDNLKADRLWKISFYLLPGSWKYLENGFKHFSLFFLQNNLFSASIKLDSMSTFCCFQNLFIYLMLETSDLRIIHFCQGKRSSPLLDRISSPCPSVKTTRIHSFSCPGDCFKRTQFTIPHKQKNCATGYTSQQAKKR